MLTRLSDYNILDREFSCNYRSLYEVLTITLKNRLMEVQGKIKANNEKARDTLLKKGAYMRGKFGDDSVQAWDYRQELLLFDDAELKKRAGKYREFLENNNEKATRAFCRLNKEGGCNDDVNQIRDDNGVQFKDKDSRDVT
jgi:hypothetical protein